MYTCLYLCDVDKHDHPSCCLVLSDPPDCAGKTYGALAGDRKDTSNMNKEHGTVQ